MKKIVVFLFLMGFFLPVVFAQEGSVSESTFKQEAPKVVSSFEGGRLYKEGNLSIVELWGSYRQMGRQYGHLLKKELEGFYQLAVEKGLVGRMGYSEISLAVRARSIFDLYPLRLKEIVYGLSEGSGLALDKILILNQLVSIMMLENDTYASVLAVKGPLAKDGLVICGSSFDYPSWFSDLMLFLTVAVFNPSDNVNSVALAGFPACLEAVSAVNETGLFIFSADASLSAGKSHVSGRSPVLTLMLGYLLDYSTFGQLDAAIASMRPDYPVIITAAGKNDICSYECSSFDVVRRQPQDGNLLSAVNFFLDPSWRMDIPQDDFGFSSSRYNNLAFFGEDMKGDFSSAGMKDIFSRPISKGGVVISEAASYQIVVLPEDLNFFLKMPNVESWIEVNLSGFFGLTKEAVFNQSALAVVIESEKKAEEQDVVVIEPEEKAVSSGLAVAPERSLNEIIASSSQEKQQSSSGAESLAEDEEDNTVLKW